jgi:hypothetical protein
MGTHDHANGRLALQKSAQSLARLLGLDMKTLTLRTSRRIERRSKRTCGASYSSGRPEVSSDRHNTSERVAAEAREASCGSLQRIGDRVDQPCKGVAVLGEFRPRCLLEYLLHGTEYLRETRGLWLPRYNFLSG